MEITRQGDDNATLVEEVSPEQEVTEEQVSSIVDQAFEKVDKDGDNRITMDEFVVWAETSKAMKNQMFKLGFNF